MSAPLDPGLPNARFPFPAYPNGWARAFRLSLAVYLAFRLYLASLPGYTWDVEMIKTWSLGIAINGLSRTYESTSVDYPPLYIYLLQPIGEFYLALHPELLENEVVRQGDELLFVLDLTVAAAHEAFDREQSVARIRDLLVACGLTNETLALIGDGHDGGGRPIAGGVDQHLWPTALHNRDDRVRGPKVDSDDLGHLHIPS